jgi:hypothetical protein
MNFNLLDNFQEVENSDELPSDVVKLQQQVKDLQSRLKAAQRSVRTSKGQQLKQEKKLEKLFAPDQSRALTRTSMRGVPWSAETVKKGLQLRFACGSAGYNLLLRQGFPLPNERTLQRRIQHIEFEPGVLHSVLKYMELKVLIEFHVSTICYALYCINTHVYCFFFFLFIINIIFYWSFEG